MHKRMLSQASESALSQGAIGFGKYRTLAPNLERLEESIGVFR
jgi:hypothetical protein